MATKSDLEMLLEKRERVESGESLEDVYGDEYRSFMALSEDDRTALVLCDLAGVLRDYPFEAPALMRKALDSYPQHDEIKDRGDVMISMAERCGAVS